MSIKKVSLKKLLVHKKFQVRQNGTFPEVLIVGYLTFQLLVDLKFPAFYTNGIQHTYAGNYLIVDYFDSCMLQWCYINQLSDRHAKSFAYAFKHV